MMNKFEALCYNRPVFSYEWDGHKFWFFLYTPTNGTAMMNALSTGADLMLDAAHFAFVNRKYRLPKLMDIEITRRAV